MNLVHELEKVLYQPNFMGEEDKVGVNLAVNQILDKIEELGFEIVEAKKQDMFKVGDIAEIDNINGETNTCKVGVNGDYAIHTGGKVTIVCTRKNEKYNIDGKTKDGIVLSFNESELKLL